MRRRDDQLGAGLVWHGHHKRASALETGMSQDLGVRGVAEERRHLLTLQVLHARRIHLDHQTLHPDVIEYVDDVMSDAPPAHDDHMAGQSCADRCRRGAVLVQDPPKRRNALQRALDRVDQAKHQRVERDRDQGARQDKAVLIGVDQAQAQTGLTDDERELADLAQPGGDHKRSASGVGEEEPDAGGEHGFAEHDQRRQRQHLPGVRHEVNRVHKHADRDEEDHGERFLERQDVDAHLVAERRFAHDHAGQKRAQRQRHAEDRRGAQGGPQRNGEDNEDEQLARLREGDPLEQPRNRTTADNQHQSDEGAGLHQGPDQRGAAIAFARGPERGQGDQDQDCRQVFQHKPADGHLAMTGIEQPLIHQPAQEDDRAGDRDRQAEDQPGAQGPAPELAEPKAEPGGDQHLDYGARDGDVSDPPEVIEREMQPHPKHEEDHAELSQLADRFAVADKAGRKRPDRHPGQEIADDGRQPDEAGEVAADERNAQRDTDVDQQVDIVQRSLLDVRAMRTSPPPFVGMGVAASAGVPR